MRAERRWQVVAMLTLVAMPKQVPLLATTPSVRGFVLRSPALAGPPARAASRGLPLAQIRARRGLCLPLPGGSGPAAPPQFPPPFLGSRPLRPAFCASERVSAAALGMSAVGGQGDDGEKSHFFASLTPNRPAGIP
jgi:hypothetical protein